MKICFLPPAHTLRWRYRSVMWYLSLTSIVRLSLLRTRCLSPRCIACLYMIYHLSTSSLTYLHSLSLHSLSPPYFANMEVYTPPYIHEIIALLLSFLLRLHCDTLVHRVCECVLVTICRRCIHLHIVSLYIASHLLILQIWRCVHSYTREA